MFRMRLFLVNLIAMSALSAVTASAGRAQSRPGSGSPPPAAPETYVERQGQSGGSPKAVLRPLPEGLVAAGASITEVMRSAFGPGPASGRRTQPSLEPAASGHPRGSLSAAARGKLDATLLSLVKDSGPVSDSARPQVTPSERDPIGRRLKARVGAHGGAGTVTQAPSAGRQELRVLVTTDDIVTAQQAGLRVLGRVGDQVAGVVLAGNLADLAALPSVRGIRSPTRFEATNDRARADSGVDWSANELGATGDGVIVAAIDSGIDFTHPTFRNSDGTTRLRALLDMAYPGDVDADGVLDGPVGGGTEYTAAEIDAALQQGNGEVYRVSSDEPLEGDRALVVALDVPGDAPAATTLDVHIDLSHEQLDKLELTIRDPAGRVFPIPLVGTANQLQATYRLQLPRRFKPAGQWKLEMITPPDTWGSFGSFAVIVNRLVQQQDFNGHGTHVMGTAGGTGQTTGGDRGFAGVATGASLLFVRGPRGLHYFDEDDQLTSLAWIDQQARALGQPYVVNMSLGGQYGAHDGSSPVEQAIDQLVGTGRAGKAVVVAAGNDGDHQIHAGGELRPGQDTIPFDIEPAEGQDGVGRDWATLWFEGSPAPTLGLSWPNPARYTCESRLVDEDGNYISPLPDCTAIRRLTAGGPTVAILLWDPDDVLASILTITWARHAVSSASEIALNWSATENYWVLNGTWSLRLAGARGRWDAWDLNGDCRPLLDCDTGLTLGMPGTARNAITVGAHTTRAEWIDIDGQPRTRGEKLATLATFSSRGPTRDGRAKPEITAPGAALASALSATVEACPYLSPQFCQVEDPDSVLRQSYVTEEHQVMSGTSMATPMVAGAVALLLGQQPSLDAAAIKELLRQGARQDDYTGRPPAAHLWGAGKLDAYRSLQRLRGELTPAPSGDRVSVAGLTFIAERDVHFPAQPSGSGTRADPIVLPEAISGPAPVIRIEGFATLDNRAEIDPPPPPGETWFHQSFWLQPDVANHNDEACHHFDHELQSEPGRPSPEDDGLAFAQGEERVRPYLSNRFFTTVEEAEARDFVNFSDGLLPVGATGWFRYVVSMTYSQVLAARTPGMDAPTGVDVTRLGMTAPAVPQAARGSGPRQALDVAWLVQRCNRVPVTPEPTAFPPRPTVPPRPTQPAGTARRTVFLPLVLSDPGCPPRDQYSDVVLVVDASTSMLETLPDGRKKFEVALEAARAFVADMRLHDSGPSDQIAIVAFNNTSEVVQGLTSSQATLDQALDRFTPIVQQSRIELGIYGGLVELMGPHHREANRRVMVVLSDGRANPVPGEEAVQAAAGAKAAGVLVYVLGIGPSIDETVLLAMATDRARYSLVPSLSDLKEIMAGLAATRIPCAPENYWPSGAH